ncbi:MAG TPA: cell envelope integrity protein TolA [Burkholderiales bacterium]
MSTLAFPGQHEPAFKRSVSLSALVHIVLFAVMFLGVRWQSHRPDVIEVELWDTPPVQPAPPLQPQAVQAIAPPKVEPAPRVEKPAIAVREAPKPKPKPEPKKPEVKAKPKADPEFDKRMREQLAQEQKSLDQERRERALNDLVARAQVDASARALAAWEDKIRAKIRGNIILPPGIVGNPEALFDVTQLPTGEILNVVKRKSSGHAGYDEAVERAILKSSPLPKPEQAGLFRRELKLKFRPLD